MSFSIKNHRLYRDGIPVDYRPTPNKSSGTIDPSVLTFHDTAGRLEKGNSVSWLVNPAAKASAQAVIERDGAITQLAPFNAKCWHAGRSVFQGVSGVNSLGPGIEIVNPGKMEGRPGADFARAWWGETFSVADYDLEYVSTPEHGSGWWMPYTEEQIEAALGMAIAIVGKYPKIETPQRLTTHWTISPGRKVDTNPLFPLERIRSRVFGRADPEPIDADDDGGLYVETVTGLNLRRWPSRNDNVIGTLPLGTRCRVIRSGVYADGFPEARWHLVAAILDGVPQEGWVHSGYVTELG
ncbi:N-acetylmuramoyl-L-alanine amidase [Amorphus coralli]|uniref:N-acetylmuramoyl-L-alanine amidase n=1 Tax=Amorphus coralli TaxID=340680 RepID=UPI0003687985|nr:N-acetylmuramoyl-L-alanine amidase [Amorphus coralli]